MDKEEQFLREGVIDGVPTIQDISDPKVLNSWSAYPRWTPKQAKTYTLPKILIEVIRRSLSDITPGEYVHDRNKYIVASWIKEKNEFALPYNSKDENNKQIINKINEQTEEHPAFEVSWKYITS